MLIGLQIYYLSVVGALFLYAVWTPRNALRAFPIGIALNVFPLALLPYFSMDTARLGGLPLVYLPITAVGLALIAQNGTRVPRRHAVMYVLACIYLIYTFCNTVLAHGASSSNLIYWLAWPLNLAMFIATASLVGRMEPEFLDRVLNRCVMLMVAAALVGLARFAFGISTDANFMPVMNRNGTVVLITLLFPLVFHVHHVQRKSTAWLLFCAGTIALCVTLTYSRSGLIGLAAGALLYYGRLSLMGLLKTGACVLVLALFLSSGVAERTTERLATTDTVVSALIEGRELDPSMSDRNRLHLVNAALATADEHFWFGTGLGMENYREGLREAGHGQLRSKAHNFYISYFAELGLVGFVLLLATLQRIYAGLPPLNSPYRAFRVSFLVMALMMTMNEYILLPELWLLFGMLAGMSHSVQSLRHGILRSSHD